MFSFAMTSGLASDFDKFKIIITLRRAQKFGDTGPYKNFDSKKISIPNGTVMCLKSTVPVLGTLGTNGLNMHYNFDTFFIK